MNAVKPKNFYKPKHFVCFYYLCKPLTNKIKLNQEAEAFIWIKPKDFKKLKILEPAKQAIKELLKQTKAKF